MKYGTYSIAIKDEILLSRFMSGALDVTDWFWCGGEKGK